MGWQHNTLHNFEVDCRKALFKAVLLWDTWDIRRYCNRILDFKMIFISYFLTYSQITVSKTEISCNSCKARLNDFIFL
jgi:hypothetical protein